MACALVGCHARGVLPENDDRGDFYTTLYLEQDEALELALPRARRIVPAEIELSEEEIAAVEQATDRPLRQRRLTVHIGLDAGAGEDVDADDVTGYAVIHEEIGKFKYITFIVGIEPDLSVRRVEIMVYREARGGEVAQRRFLVQYEGKTVRDAFSINRDIINITGATMSVNALNRGVQMILAVVGARFGEGGRGLERALEASAAQDPDSPGAAAQPGGETTATLPVRRDTRRLASIRRARVLMGTLCQIEIEAHTARRAESEAAIEAALDEIARVESLLSDYRPSSDLSTLGRRGHHGWMEIHATTAEFLAAAAALTRASGGAFDITVGPLVEAWGFRGPAGRAPTAAELADVAQRIGHDRVRLRQRDGAWQARLDSAGMRLDPGGLGKGFAIDRAVAVLRDQGVENALVNFSGCIYALGAPPDAAGWPVALRDPADPARILEVVTLRDRALSTSGGHATFRVVDGKPISHIVSPVTLRPCDVATGAVVCAPTATLADGWSTAAVVLGAATIDTLRQAARDASWPGDVSALVAVRSADGALQRLVTDNWHREIAPAATASHPVEPCNVEASLATAKP